MDGRGYRRRALAADCGVPAVVAATAGAYVLHWRLWWPVGPWLWTALTAALAVAVLSSVGRTAVRLRHGPRLRAVGRLLLATWPVVAVACYGWDTRTRALERQSVPPTAARKVFGFWACGAARAQAWWQLPHRHVGAYVELHAAAPQADAAGSVARMDGHVRRMATLLAVAPPRVRAVWARGELLGLTGRAIHDLAIARPELTGPPESIDRHEVAHAVITRLAGPDQDPPTLLVEGWAECHCHDGAAADRASAVRTLHGLRTAGTAKPLRELVGPDLYHRAPGAVYTHGAALAVHLLERFGGPAFLELYRGVRPDTFAADVRRILGVGWDELEADFWRWLDAEAAALGPAAPTDATQDRVRLAEGVDAELWRRFLEVPRRYPFAEEDLPDPLAFAATVATDGVVSREDACVRDGDHVWLVRRTHGERPVREWLVSTAALHGFRRQEGDGPVEAPLAWSASGQSDFEQFARTNATQVAAQHLLADRFAQGMDLGDGLQGEDHLDVLTVRRVRPPAVDGPDRWTMAFRVAWQDQRWDHEVTLDAATGRVVRHAFSSAQDSRERDFGALADDWPHRPESTLDGKDGRSVTRVRLLDDAEAAAVRRTAGRAVAAEVRPWHERLTQSAPAPTPTGVAVLWAALALASLGTEPVRRRLRFPRCRRAGGNSD